MPTTLTAPRAPRALARLRTIVRKKSEPWSAPPVVLPLTARRCRNGQFRIVVEGRGRIYFDRTPDVRLQRCAVTGEVIPAGTEHLRPHLSGAALSSIRISIPGWEYLEALAS
jgi:hypothetical protein